MMTLNEFLNNVYYDISHPAGYSSVNTLYKYAKIIYPHVTYNEIKDFLSQQRTYTLHKPVRRRWVRNRILVSGPDEQFQADLCDMQLVSKFNNGYKYILTVIDCFSKYAWGLPLKNKTSDSIVDAFKIIFKERKPEKLQTDKGREFVNKPFLDFLKKHNVHFFTSQDDIIKCSIVERFNRTLKSKIFKYFTFKNTKRYLDVLPEIVNTYNKTVHRSTKYRPVDVNLDNKSSVFNNLYDGKSMRELLKNKMKNSNMSEGDQVRISKHRGVFSKGYHQGWSEEVFNIAKSFNKDRKSMFDIKDLNNERIIGKFYPEEIQKIKLSHNPTYQIEKIIRKKKSGNKTLYFVKWKDYPDTFNSWIDAKDIKAQ